MCVAMLLIELIPSLKVYTHSFQWAAGHFPLTVKITRPKDVLKGVCVLA